MEIYSIYMDNFSFNTFHLNTVVPHHYFHFLSYWIVKRNLKHPQFRCIYNQTIHLNFYGNLRHTGKLSLSHKLHILIHNHPWPIVLKSCFFIKSGRNRNSFTRFNRVNKNLPYKHFAIHCRLPIHFGA